MLSAVLMSIGRRVSESEPGYMSMSRKKDMVNMPPVNAYSIFSSRAAYAFAIAITPGKKSVG